MKLSELLLLLKDYQEECGDIEVGITVHNYCSEEDCVIEKENFRISVCRNLLLDVYTTFD